MADHTSIVSSTPGRTRIRLSRKRRSPKEMVRLAKALEKSPEISSVEANLHTGTLIVYHKKESLHEIRTALQDMGVVLMAASGVEMPSPWLSEAISDLDTRLRLLTKNALDLKLLVPLGFGALAILQLLRRGLQIEGAPWYILAFFAFDSFIRLNEGDKTVESAPEEPITKALEAQIA